MEACGSAAASPAAYRPAWYTRALSSDKNQDWINQEAVNACRAIGAKVVAWCDCRASGGTDAAYAIEDAHRFGIPWIGQAENSAEMDNALTRGREYGFMPIALVGNLQLRLDQLDAIRKRDMPFINETYYNVMPWIPEGGDWLDVANGILGNCVAMYASSTEGATRYPLSEMESEGKFVRGRDSIYTPGGTHADVVAA